MKNVYGLFESSPLRASTKGQILIYEGDPIRKLYYIITGYVKVYNILDNGSESIIFVYGPGDIFPFTSYLSGSGAARYFYECMTDIKFKSIMPKEFELKVKDNIKAGEALINYTSAVGEQFIQRIDVLSVNSAQRKVIALLAFLIDKTGSKDEYARLDIPLTTQDIADMCGLTRETTSLQLGELRKKGILSGSRNLIINSTKLSKIKPALAISH
jgi:CRP/FNR family transcriptional regulator